MFRYLFFGVMLLSFSTLKFAAIGVAVLTAAVGYASYAGSKKLDEDQIKYLRVVSTNAYQKTATAVQDQCKAHFKAAGVAPDFSIHVEGLPLPYKPEDFAADETAKELASRISSEEISRWQEICRKNLAAANLDPDLFTFDREAARDLGQLP